MENTPVLYTVDEVMAILRCGRSLFYELVKGKRLKIVKLQGKTLIRKNDLDEFLATLAA